MRVVDLDAHFDDQRQFELSNDVHSGSLPLDFTGLQNQYNIIFCEMNGVSG
jgi:hypothetical protein